MNVWDFLFGERGAAVPHRKAVPEETTAVMPAPKTVTLLLSQHIGAPCTPTVAVGDTVAVGQCVADSDKPVSAPIHSPVSGKVKAIAAVRQGAAIVIENDGEGRIHESVAPPNVHDRASFLAAVRASGLVGLGGAGFPTHIKLAPKNPKAVDTLVINAAECEPYITADYRECMEAAQDVIAGITAVCRWLAIPRAIIGVEANKPAAIALLKKTCAGNRAITVKTLPSRYPQGAEKMLIHSCTGRRVPEGGLPADAGCIVMNVTSVGFLARYLASGMPLTQKRITVAGGGVEKPQNLLASIGTPIEEILAFCGWRREATDRLLMGGPMMGVALPAADGPLMKQNNAILALTAKELAAREPSPCLHCGRCVAACPMHLVPTAMADAFAKEDFDELKKRHLLSCLECGCCAYACPACRPLVQTFRSAKAALRAQK